MPGAHARPGRQRIIGALVELVAEKDMADITIKEVVRRADTNRSTFYYSFHGLDDVLECAMEQFLERYLRDLELTDGAGPIVVGGDGAGSVPTLGAIRFTLDNMPAFRALATGSCSERFRQRWIDTMFEAMRLYDWVLVDGEGTPVDFDRWELEGWLRLQVGSYYTILEYLAQTRFEGTAEDYVSLMFRLFSPDAKSSEMSRKTIS